MNVSEYPEPAQNLILPIISHGFRVALLICVDIAYHNPVLRAVRVLN